MAFRHFSTQGLLKLEREQYDMLCQESVVDLLSETRQNDGISLGSDIEVIAQQRKQENRENLVAGRAIRKIK